jgi:AcrR family transcriptional regulator
MKNQFKEGTLLQFMPRRTPRQKRSQILFEKIIATAKVLFERDGYAYVSTNTIAQKANVSIGSLYQYFKNCESIALAIYENACSKAALTMKRRTLESFSLPIETSIPKHIGWVFDVFEKDRYALLQLINEVPELRRVSQPLSFDSLISQTTQMFLEQHYPDVDRAIIARKSYVLDRCVLGVMSRYLDERPDFLGREEAIAEITELVRPYVATLARHQKSATAGSRST